MSRAGQRLYREFVLGNASIHIKYERRTLIQTQNEMPRKPLLGAEIIASKTFRFKQVGQKPKTNKHPPEQKTTSKQIRFSNLCCAWSVWPY